MIVYLWIEVKSDWICFNNEIYVQIWKSGVLLRLTKWNVVSKILNVWATVNVTWVHLHLTWVYSWADALENMGAGTGARKNLETGNDGRIILETGSYCWGQDAETRRLMLRLKIGVDIGGNSRTEAEGPGQNTQELRMPQRSTDLSNHIKYRLKRLTWYKGRLLVILDPGKLWDEMWYRIRDKRWDRKMVRHCFGVPGNPRNRSREQ